MARRQYSNIAVDTTLNAGITSGATSLTVADATGWPSAPFLLAVEPDTADEELILVGAKSGTTFSSLTRGYGGTSAVAHDGGDVVKHIIAAEDLSFIWTHAHDGADDSAQVSHDDLTAVSVDDHHAQSHAHDGVDGSGTVAHSDTTGQGADDHHDENHASRHAPGGADPISLLSVAADIRQITQPVGSITSQTLDFGVVEETSVGVDWSDVSGVVTFATAGWYEVEVNIEPTGWDSGVGDLEIRYRMNGDSSGNSDVAVARGTGNVPIAISRKIKVDAAETLEIYAMNHAGGGSTITSDRGWRSIAYIGP